MAPRVDGASADASPSPSSDSLSSLDRAVAPTKLHRPLNLRQKGEAHGERLVFFRVGPLRFGVHGVAGMLGAVFVSYGLWCLTSASQRERERPDGGDCGSGARSLSSMKFLCVAIVATTLTSSVGSYGLMNQVPATSEISSFIFPPHREAFQRTIAVVGYLNLRLVHQWGWTNDLALLVDALLSRTHGGGEATADFGGGAPSTCEIEAAAKECIAYPILLFLYTNYHFFPRRFDVRNGNTWVFVAPMFVGLSADALRQFPSLSLREDGGGKPEESWSTVNIARGLGVILSRYGKAREGGDDPPQPQMSIQMRWEGVHDWNRRRVDEAHLLLTLLGALQIAFMFTVAFRGRMSVRRCYWIAAAEVALLGARLAAP